MSFRTLFGIREDVQDTFARRASSFEVSPWEQVGRLLDTIPGAVSFANGAPAAELMPKRRLQEAAAAVWADPANLELGYGGVRGFAPLRELIARRMAAQGVEVDPAAILLTNGSQQGIDLIARLMLDPGDTVIVEGPAYIGALQVFDACEATYLVIPVDADGMDIGSLEAALAGLDRAPKLIYTVPTFQNPTGATMTRERRQALVALARRYGILLVEDDPYGELRYDGEALPPLRALDPDVVYLGTFSKTIAPGLRLGWMISPSAYQEPLTNLREVADIHGDRMTTQIVYRTADGFLDEHLVGARAAYAARRDALMDALDAEMPDDVFWATPEGGFFAWLDLPSRLDPTALLETAEKAGVVYLPGGLFYPGYVAGPGARNGVRLSFSTLSQAEIQSGVARLGRLFRG